jgi:hypothetical protein
MGLVRYFVFRSGDGWLVTQDGAAMGRHSSQDAAVASAVVMADLMGAMKYDADVMIENEGRLALAWSYGASTPLAGQQAA